VNTDPDLEKWQFLKTAPARDAQTEEMRNFAHLLWMAAQASPWPRWFFCNLALCVARDGIVYMSDLTRVGREQIDGFTDPQGSTLASLERGTDDCDAKARLFVALCLAVGIPAETVPRWRGEAFAEKWRGRTLSHVSARVYIAGPLEHSPRWWPVETILDRARIGDVAEAVPVEIDTRRWAQTKFERAS